MTKSLKFFLIALITFTLFFYGIQYAIVQQLESTHFYYSTWSIYVFNFFVTLFIYLSILFVNKTFIDKTGLAFMACSVLKIMVAFLFLLPLIQNKENSGLNDVFAFFIPYFLYLFFETFFVLKILNKK